MAVDHILHLAVPVRGAVQRIVVNDDGNPVLGQLDVNLHPGHKGQLHCLVDGRQCVLRRSAGESPMGNA
ncbi:hypothetical protein D3C71_2012040 [compost metagenome]